jgi:hypothetical protein
MAYAVLVHEPAAAGYPVTWRRLFNPKLPAPPEVPPHVLDAHLTNLRIATTALENAVGLITAHLQVSDARSGIVAQGDRHASDG